MTTTFYRLLPILGFSLLASCSSLHEEEQVAEVAPRQLHKQDPAYVNPFPKSSYAHFVASKDYPVTFGTYLDKTLLNTSGNQQKKIHICLKEQRGRLYVGNKVAIDFPTSTGVSDYPTKPGSYKVISKEVDHTSNLYGKMYDAEGKCIDSNANATDAVPEGGKFVGSPMPYWQRLTGAGLGLHVGNVRRRPVSHGCIRLQPETAKTLYKETKIGTPVFIQQDVEKDALDYKAPIAQNIKQLTAE